MASPSPYPPISGPHSLASTVPRNETYSFERNPRDVRTYTSSFRSRPYTTQIRQDRIGWRSGEPGDPTDLVRTVQQDPRLFSGMTKRSAARSPEWSRRAATAGIKDFYNLAGSVQPDMAVAVERSPIKYSLFNASAIKAPPSSVIAAARSPQARSPDATDYGEHARAHAEASFEDFEDDAESAAHPRSIRGGSWDRGDRFLAEGHPLSMFHKYTCRNELTEGRRGTIATNVEESEMRYLSLSDSLAHTHTLSLSFSLALSLTHTHFLTHTPSHSLTGIG